MPKIRVAVLASGRGTDFQSVIDGVESGRVNAEIVLLVVNKPEAKAIERAEKHGIPHVVIDHREFEDRLKHDEAVWKKLDEEKIDLVVLAGYMRVIKNKEFLKAYRGKIINIHPSLLPSFAGATAQKDAFEAGVKVSGYTIHFVDDSLDGGAIIWQEAVDISDCESADEVSARILEREHAGLPKVVDSFSKGKWVVRGNRTRFEPYA